MNDAQYKEAIEQKRALSDLLTHKGWSILEQIISEQIRTRTDRVILVPIGELQSIEQQEFMKGEITAYRTLLSYPKELISSAVAIIEQIDLERKVSSNDGPDSEE